MNMQVIEHTKVVSRREIALEASLWIELELQCQLAFTPGQYVMITYGDPQTAWPHDYLIQRAEGRTFSILARKHEPMHRARVGDEVCIWGPLGRHPQNTEHSILVTEKSCYPLILPFCAPDREVFVLGEREKAIEESGAGKHTWFYDCASLAEALKKTPRPILAALQYPNLREIAHAVGDGRLGRMLVFVGVRKFCGVDACKGCYVHAKENGEPIRVCGEGPYLPYTRIDYERDHALISERI